MTSADFNPRRLTVARQKRGWTKAKLAEVAGLTSRSVTAYEAGETTPSDETASILARVLAFPLSFFFLDDPSLPNPEAVSFRALTSLSASQRDKALAAGALAVELERWMERQLNLPACKLLDCRGYTPSSAAAALRARWGIGELPIKNTIHLLEAHGVRVFSLAEECKKVDAFSFWRSTTPFVFLNTYKTAERSRFDAMHELGHLVLHRSGGPTGREAEYEADQFAAAMLMPASDVFACAPRFVTLPLLIKLKRRWSVSVVALIHRFHDLNLISDWQYRTLCVQAAEQGFRKSEPNSCPRETSLLLQKAFALVREAGFTRAQVAEQVSVSRTDLETLVFGLILTTLPGGMPPSGERSPIARPDFKVVAGSKK